MNESLPGAASLKSGPATLRVERWGQAGRDYLQLGGTRLHCAPSGREREKAINSRRRAEWILRQAEQGRGAASSASLTRVVAELSAPSGEQWPLIDIARQRQNLGAFVASLRASGA